MNMNIPFSFNKLFSFLVFTLLINQCQSWTKIHDGSCGNSQLIQPKGMISSPYYPMLFPNTVYCTWHILSPPQSILKIHIKDFDVPDDPGCDRPPCCRYNFVKLPVNGKAGAYEQVCGNMSQSVISVSQTHTTIVFCYGSPSHHGRGFKLTYSIEKNVCNGEFACKDGSCLPMSKRCDGIPQCLDGDDEMLCPGNSDCEFGIKCETVDECYLPSQRCDGYYDCGDKSDELDCPEMCSILASKRQCRNGHCIDARLWCDGNDDCGDFSDEEACLKNSMITIAMMGALLGGLFLVLAVGCSLRIYSRRCSPGHNCQLRLSPPTAPHFRMPHSLSLPALIDNEFFHREPPPMYNVAVGNAGLPRRSRESRSRGSSRRSNHPHRHTVAVPVPKPPSDNTLNNSSSPSSEDSLMSSSNIQTTNTDDSEQLISA